jgi:hypothetical protein
MSDQVRLWHIGPAEHLTEIGRAALDLESRLQEWLARDISILDPGLLVIGREVSTDFGGFIDILCIDREGDITVIELKRDRTPREVVAQALDYASWVVDLSAERVSSVANERLDGEFESAFRMKFGADLPETLNGDHRVVVVGSNIDASSERIVKYLSDTHGVNINAATFQYFQLPDGSELLARVFLIEPADVDLNTRTKGSSKRRPILTYEELATLADQAGVSELYEHAVTSFETLLRKRTTQSSLAFVGSLNGSHKTVIALSPGESSADEGLHYRIYKNRFAELTKRTVQKVEDLMPLQRHDFHYWPQGGPEWEAFEGFITTRDEIDRLARALRQAQTA